MRTTRTVALAALVVLAGSLAHAQRGPGRGGRHQGMKPGGDGPPRRERMMADLNLTNEQYSQMRAIKLAQRKSSIEQRSQAELKAVELHELLVTGDPDMGRVESKLREIADVRVGMRMAQIRAHQQIRSLLTDEQKAKFDRFKPHMGMGGPENRGRRHERRGGGERDWLR
ncbi:MAG: Spy/CpxP family protein refolding chaperone [Candidatus Latescibacteria bacterium]|nr:Spy/CpxP family protein refolding chaperone [Candidatus Latescibacterota bacterium]